MSGSSSTQWTIVDLMTIVMGALLIGTLMLMVSARPRRYHNSLPMKNLTHVRGITQSLVIYAASNNDYYPGVNSKGKLIDATIEHRFWELLDNNAFTGDYIISRYETKTEWTTGKLTSDNYSYAMLEIKDGLVPGRMTGRRQEWRDTINADVIVVSDRNIGPDAQNVMSLQSPTQGRWEGAVARNDGSAVIETTHLLDTRYGKNGQPNIDDNIFEPSADDDAYMIYTGN